MPQTNFHFTISERKLYLRFFDIVVVILGMFAVNYFFDFQYFNFQSSDIFVWLITLVFYLLFFGEVFEMYNLRVASDKYLVIRSTFITSLFVTIFYIFTPIISPVLPQNRIQILYFILALLIPLLINRFIYIQLIFSPRFLKNILIIAEETQIKQIISLKQQSNNIAAYISKNELETLKEGTFYPISDVQIENVVTQHQINEILVSSEDPKFVQKLNKQLIELFEKGVVINSIYKFLEEETNRICEDQLTTNFYTSFTFSKSHQNNLYLTFKRLLDILFALTGIVLFFVLVPLVLIANLIANKGKLIYKQKRVGKRGKEFIIFKFRTMISNAEENGVQWAEKNDRRVTPFGRILRKTRLDEVPQFFNVLKGEMSLIGSRPERPEFVKKLEKELPFYAIRHVIKPGLTGWAQVMHPYANTIEDQQKKLMYDLYYIKERNLLLDFKIVIKTISTILFFRGT